MNKDTLKNVKTLAVVCTQWGDTGKGKLVDYFGEWADVIARGTGGDNAGHTIVFNGSSHVFHLVPSGILHADKLNIIGNGVVVNPRVLLDELAILAGQGIPYDNLKIALNAKLVLPQHIVLDRIRESGPNKIGTTGRGIGPAYEDHYRRTGLVVNDLLNPDIFAAKLRWNLEEKVRLLRGYDRQLFKDIMSQPFLGYGLFHKNGDELFSVNSIIRYYLEYGEKLSGMIDNTDAMVRGFLGNKRILLEGAQGNLLSVDFGSYPFVTSSDCSIQGLAKGVGLTAKDVDLTIGIVKAFYMTRVGEGPFPTEMGAGGSAVWCAHNNREAEEKRYPTVSLDPTGDEFLFGIAVRRAGAEYGATTGRPRRVGWLDIPLLRYSSQIAGVHGKTVALTKLDVLDRCPVIKVCVGYRYNGPDCHVGQLTLRNGDTLKTAIPNDEVLRHCRPVYAEFPGWMTDISAARTRGELPPKLLELIEFVEMEAGVKTILLSVGADREQTIF